MGKLKSSCQREYQVIQFLLFKTVPEHGTVFVEVPENPRTPGDILLFPLDPMYVGVPRSFKHAAVYCGDEEVIHFQGTSMSGNIGKISKEGFRAMKKERGKCQVYRKKGGVDLNDFRSKVKEVMNCEAEYHCDTNNCIHFALYLLGLADFYQKLVQIQSEGDGSSGVARSCHMV